MASRTTTAAESCRCEADWCEKVGAGEFVQKAGVTDPFEIEAARLALDRSRNENVRNFAQKTISLP
jgi:predicted outer membrane protein